MVSPSQWADASGVRIDQRREANRSAKKRSRERQDGMIRLMPGDVVLHRSIDDLVKPHIGLHVIDIALNLLLHRQKAADLRINFDASNRG